MTMHPAASAERQKRRQSLWVVTLMLGVGALVTASVSGAQESPVGLGTAESFAVLAGAGVTNTGPTVVSGDLGACPTPAVTGFPPGMVINGTIHAGDAVCLQAQADLTIAYVDAAGRAPTTTYPGVKDLGGETLTPGVYKADAFAITGTLTLDAQGDPNAVFIFQAGSTLITAPNSRVELINGAQACNVFWQVGSSATLGVGSTFVGTILALTSITANTNAVVEGRLLARNGAVTLDSNRVTRPVCAPTTTTTSTTLPTTSTILPDITLPDITLPDITVPGMTLPDITLPDITLPDVTLPPITTTLPPTTTTTLPTTTTTLPTTTTTRPTTTTTLPTTTTTLPATTTTTFPTTTTTVPATTVTAPATTTTTTVPSSATPAEAEIAVRSLADVGGARTLAVTGSALLWEALAAGLAVALGSLMLLLAGKEPPTRRRQRIGARARLASISGTPPDALRAFRGGSPIPIRDVLLWLSLERGLAGASLGSVHMVKQIPFVASPTRLELGHTRRGRVMLSRLRYDQAPTAAVERAPPASTWAPSMAPVEPTDLGNLIYDGSSMGRAVTRSFMVRRSIIVGLKDR